MSSIIFNFFLTIICPIREEGKAWRNRIQHSRMNARCRYGCNVAWIVKSPYPLYKGGYKVQMFRLDGWAITLNQCILNHVLQFSDVAGKVIGFQLLNGDAPSNEKVQLSDSRTSTAGSLPKTLRPTQTPICRLMFVKPQILAVNCNGLLGHCSCQHELSPPV